MSNNLPTVKNIWEINENVAAATSVSTLDSYQKSLFGLKDALVSFSTNPWTVVSSSDSATSGASDFWIDSGDLIWADAGSAHSWIVLQHSVRNTQLCLNCNNTGSSGRLTSIYVSFGGNYTGGSTTNKPTAVDQVDAMVEEEWLGPTSVAFSSWIHSWQSDDGLKTRLLISTSAGDGLGGYYLFDEVDTPAPLWSQKEIVLIALQKSTATGNVLDIDTWMAVNKNQYSSTGHPNNFLSTSSRIGLLGGPLNNTSVSHFSKGSVFLNAKSIDENEFILVGDVLKFDRTDPFSISCWIRSSESTTTSMGIVNKTDTSSPNRGYSLETDSTAGTIIWKIVNTVSTNVNAIQTDISWMDGLWHHIVATWDGDVIGDATGLNLYIDGLLAATTIINNTLTSTIDTTEELRISSIGGSATTGFIGNIDDVAVYDKELNSSEITIIYNSGDPNDLRVVGPTGSLVGYWLMGDGASFPTISDESANSNDGTATNMEEEDVGYGDTPGNPLIYLRVGGHMATESTGVGAFLNKRTASSVPNELDSTFPIITDLSASGNNATAINMDGFDIVVDTPGGISTHSLVFDGVNDYLNVGDVAELRFNSSDEFSISVWVKQTGGSSAIISKSETNGGGFRGWDLRAGDEPIFRVQEQSAANADQLEITCSGAFLDDGEWHHVVVAKPTGITTGSNILFYADGVQMMTEVNVNTLVTEIEPNGAPVTIGRFEPTSPSYWGGNIDDVALYDKQLTLAEVRTIYNAGVTPFSINSMSFDGMDQFIDMGTGSALDFERTDSFSFSCWFRTISTTSAQFFCKQEDASLVPPFGPSGGSFRGYGYSFNGSTGFMSLFLSNQAANRLIVTGTTDIRDGAWHHVAMTYDGSSSASGGIIYLDNVVESVTTPSDTLSMTIATTLSAEIGARALGSESFFDGNIDDVAMYDKELSAGEVTTIYNSGMPGDLRLGGQPSNLVGYWRLGDGITSPFSNNSLKFEGTTNDYTEGRNQHDFANNVDFSIGCWFRSINQGASQTLISKRDTGVPDAGYEIAYFSGQLTFILADNATGDVSVEFGAVNEWLDGRWHHVAATWEGTVGNAASNLIFYVDGAVETPNVVLDSLAGTSSNVGPFQVSGVDFLFGAGTIRPFDGNIDDAFVYDDLLTSGEVTTIYNNGLPPDLRLGGMPGNLVGYYLMGDNDIFPVIQNQASTVFSVNGMDFDGSSESVDVGDVTALKFADTDTFSVSTWFRTTSTSTLPLVGKQESSGNLRGYIVFISASGEVLILLRNTNTGLNRIFVTTTLSGLNDDAWHHIAFTWDGSVSTVAANLTVYVDGSSQSVTVNNDNLTGTIDSTALFSIASRNSVSLFFVGEIDDVAVYDIELTSGQITTIYNNGVPNDLRVSGPTSDLVGYWLMGDDASFPTIPDESANSNDGTATNMVSGDIEAGVGHLNLGTSVIAADYVESFYLIPDDSSNSNDGQTINLVFTDISVGTPFGGVGAPTDLTTSGPTDNLVAYWAMGNNTTTPGLPIFPISLYGDYGYYGHFGFLEDLWWGSATLDSPTGSTFPSSSSARQFSQAGDIIHTWTGDSTTPLFGGTSTITNDAFDAHFIDTSDAATATAFFQMKGIDTGNPSQPAYHTWEVTGSPDPAGAQATGPDAPPFGGPLTNIIVAHQWMQ